MLEQNLYDIALGTFLKIAYILVNMSTRHQFQHFETLCYTCYKTLWWVGPKKMHVK